MAMNSPEKVLHSNGYTLITGSSLYQMSGYSGGAMEVDPITGETDFSWPKVAGTVECVEPDGNGGWFIGGNFDYIDTVKIRNLAHFLPDKSVDRNWKPNPNGSVNDMELNGSTLFVGGYFTRVFGSTRNYIAATDVNTGNLLSWNPNSSNNVRKIEFANGLVYVGGYFTNIGGQDRSYVGP
jgi:hypothetical protein